jgi:hypothetical protein
MALKITVEDLATGDKGEATVPDDGYILITDGTAYLSSTQAYRTSHVLTVKGLKNGIPTLDLAPLGRGAPGGEGGE